LPPAPTPAGPTRNPGGCLQPVLLRGHVDHVDGATGELPHRYTTVHEPGGVLPIACQTRRASQCPPYAEVYRADTYRLIRAGLSGGKGVPESVASHPCVFTTLTAPWFGPVHVHREKDGRHLRCRPPCRIRGAGSETVPERPVLTVAQVFELAELVGRRPIGNVRQLAGGGYRLRFQRHGQMHTASEVYLSRPDAERAAAEVIAVPRPAGSLPLPRSRIRGGDQAAAAQR